MLKPTRNRHEPLIEMPEVVLVMHGLVLRLRFVFVHGFVLVRLLVVFRRADLVHDRVEAVLVVGFVFYDAFRAVGFDEGVGAWN